MTEQLRTALIAKRAELERAERVAWRLVDLPDAPAGLLSGMVARVERLRAEYAAMVPSTPTEVA